MTQERIAPEDSGRALAAQAPLPESAPVSTIPAPADPLSLLLSDPDKLAALDVDKLDRLMELKLKSDAEAARREFASAFVVAQTAIPKVKPMGDGDKNTRFAKLEDVSAAIDPVAQENGFSQSFSTEPSPHGEEFTTLIYVIRHVGGHQEEHRMDAPLDYKGAKGAPNKTKLQGVASAMTYAMRQLKLKVWNIQIGFDNDGRGLVTETITQEQAEGLVNGVKMTGADMAEFCAMFEVDDISELPALKFREARLELENSYLRKHKGAGDDEDEEPKS